MQEGGIRKLIVEWIPWGEGKEDVQEKRGWKEYKRPKQQET
jgi:hypothetical protein